VYGQCCSSIRTDPRSQGPCWDPFLDQHDRSSSALRDLHPHHSLQVARVIQTLEWHRSIHRRVCDERYPPFSDPASIRLMVISDVHAMAVGAKTCTVRWQRSSYVFACLAFVRNLSPWASVRLRLLCWLQWQLIRYDRLVARVRYAPSRPSRNSRTVTRSLNMAAL
jgi:hypothetical protein